uniref:Protein kinase domain-containing protein n=1 Tax=Steinernema glaseri TaxID=37863 RepID=A0A1I8A895_9BILA
MALPPLSASHDFVRVLGSGSFGTVYLIRDQGREYALKWVCKKSSDRSSYHEKNVHRMFHGHPNVLKCLGGEATKYGYNVFLEAAPFGDLRSFVKSYGPLKRSTAYLYHTQISSALHFIHESLYCHRDLKPSNVLVFSDDLVKICDFGISCEMSFDMTVCRAGTQRYQPPETFRTVNGVHLDLWASGMIFAFALIGKHPWKAASSSCDEYVAFQNDDLKTLCQLDSRWCQASGDFAYLRWILHHDPLRRRIPPCYTH